MAEVPETQEQFPGKAGIQVLIRRGLWPPPFIAGSRTRGRGTFVSAKVPKTIPPVAWSLRVFPRTLLRCGVSLTGHPWPCARARTSCRAPLRASLARSGASARPTARDGGSAGFAGAKTCQRGLQERLRTSAVSANASRHIRLSCYPGLFSSAS